MANVSIKFNGKEFLLSCDDGQEDHLEELLIQLNQKFNDLKNNLGNLGENKLLLITAVKTLDEYYETKKKVDQKKIELRDLSNKFRELKSLVYDYRDKKEKTATKKPAQTKGAGQVTKAYTGDKDKESVRYYDKGFLERLTENLGFDEGGLVEEEPFYSQKGGFAMAEAAGGSGFQVIESLLSMRLTLTTSAS